ncbi:MAG: hypothetical protein E7177_02455 [Erysipelotrichaceae bacterium]|nr:hypothetical protein [Erysipelotrichaceae bacterium]
MKKCPYCKTFMNDDVNTCPNCLKDMSSLKPMPEVNIVGKKKNLNMIVYGAILSVGGVIASLSQTINKKNYQVKYDEILESIKNVTEQSQKDVLLAEATEYMLLISDCEFREIAFLVLAGLGLALIIATLVISLVKKFKNKKEK